MLANTTIKVRVIAAFAVVLISSLCLGLFAVQRLNAVNTAAQDVAENWLPGANTLGDVTQDFEYYRSLQGQILMTSGDMRKTKQAKLEKTAKKIEADFAAYEKTVDSAEERVLADDLQNNLRAYLDMGAFILRKWTRATMPLRSTTLPAICSRWSTSCALPFARTATIN